MSHSVLITGGSGYLGGTLLARLNKDELPAYKAIYALVRTPEQAEAVRQYGVEPLHLNLDDEAAVKQTLLDKQITIVFFLIDALQHKRQLILISALAAVKDKTGSNVHFLHTSGAKIFSEHAGMPTDRTIYDSDADLYDLQKAAKAPIVKPMDVARETNNVIIETAEKHGVKSYIFVPCIVYGKGEGFGNPTSIQTVAVVQAAKGLRQVYDVNDEKASWPVSHVLDNAMLFRTLLVKMLSDDRIAHDKSGYYLASSGSIRWRDIYEAIAKVMAKRGAVGTAEVKIADDDAIGRMAEALKCPKEMVRLQLGGHCTFSARHGNLMGWQPQYTSEHILEAADAEVELILANM